jgi:3D (Asp-Asp-Asp) domain-containing protein
MEALIQNKKRIISPQKAKNIIFFLVFVLIFNFFLFPLPMLANSNAQMEKISKKSMVIMSDRTGDILNKAAILGDNELENNLPNIDVWKTKYSVNSTITAYNSEVAQCDDSPCITANGFNVCEHGKEDTIAANFLKFGTKVRIPELFGDNIFIVRDRMNKRYSERVDVWMIEKQDARQFGVKRAKIEVLE